VQRVILIFCHFADARIQLFQGNIHRPFNMRILKLVWVRTSIQCSAAHNEVDAISMAPVKIVFSLPGSD
jgi:hypothetical protein